MISVRELPAELRRLRAIESVRLAGPQRESPGPALKWSANSPARADANRTIAALDAAIRIVEDWLTRAPDSVERGPPY